MLDHLVFGFPDLEMGIQWMEEASGVRAATGGVHPGGGTRNALVSLGGRRYLEIIAPDPAQPGVIGRFGDLSALARPRIITWAAATDSIEDLRDRAVRAGCRTGPIVPGSRTRPDGKVLKWRNLDIVNEFGGLFPFFIEWAPGSVHPSDDSPGGCALVSVELEHPDPETLARLLEITGLRTGVSRAPEPAIVAHLDTPRGRIEIA